MSERKIREFAKDTAGYYAPVGVRQLCADLLADDPDIVVLLRWLRDYMLKWGEESWAWNACEPVVLFITETFGVRLTDDDGWEWTEEGSDAE